VGPSVGLDEVEERKFLTLPGLELRPLGRLPRSQSLYRLRYPGSPIRWVSGVKWPRRETDHSPPSNAEVKNDGTIPPLINMSSWHKDNFSFTSNLIYYHSNFRSRRKLAQDVRLLPCIKEQQIRIQVRTRRFYWFSSVPPGNCQIRLRPLPSASFRIHKSSSHPTPYTLRY
jgi:hypothetical protein